MADREICLTAPERAELRDSPPPGGALPADAVEGRTLFTAVSPGTELSLFAGHYAEDGFDWARFPMVPGYAASVELTAVGGAVDDLAPGDRVFCMGPHRSRQRVPRREVLPLPPGLDPAIAPLARLMNVTWTTLSRTAIAPPARVLVTGLGPIGMLGALVFARAGYRVCAADPIPERRALAENLGIERTSAAPAEDDAIAGAIDLVLECSAHEAAMRDGLRCLRRHGELVQVGVPMRPKTGILAQELANLVFRRCVALRGGSEWQVPMHAEDGPSIFGQIATALAWLADGSVPAAGLTAVALPDDPQGLYEQVRARSRDELITILDWSTVGA